MRFGSLLYFLFAGLIGFCGLTRAEEALQLHYDFETEDAVDKSGNGFDGTLLGAPNMIKGVEGNAWEFDGGTKIDLEFAEFKEARSQFSVRCFIKPEESKGIHVIYDEGGAWTGYCLRIADGDLQFGTVCCAEVHPPTEIVSVELPDTEEWIDVAAVFDNGKMTLYMNGKNVGDIKTEWAQLGAHGQACGIGEKNAGNTAFDEGGGFYIGGMDELRVYTRPLQAGEVKSAVSALDKLAIAWGYLKNDR